MRRKITFGTAYLVLVIGLLLFFIDGPDYDASRLQKRVWDLGHIVYFYILATMVLKKSKKLFRKNLLVNLSWIFGCILLFGILVEFLQIGFTRLPELGDIWRDFLGAMLALFFPAMRGNIPVSDKLKILKYTAIGFVIIESYAPFKALVDQEIAKFQYPVLSNLETPFELDRWDAEGRIVRTEKFKFRGSYSLQCEIPPGRYSGIALKYFPRDWRGFSFFSFTVNNPDSVDIFLSIRINDKQHRLYGEKYHDRYNKKIVVHPGWNKFNLSLEEIKMAPRKREMDLTQILLIRLFASSVRSPFKIYLDEFTLE